KRDTRLLEHHNREAGEAEYYYRYAETLKNVGENSKSDEYFNRYASTVSGRRTMLIKEQKDYMEEIRANSGRYNHVNLIEVNSESSDRSEEHTSELQSRENLV